MLVRWEKYEQMNITDCGEKDVACEMTEGQAADWLVAQRSYVELITADTEC